MRRYLRIATVNGATNTYDAFDKLVETSAGPTQFLYLPGGTQPFATMSNYNSFLKIFAPAPGGAMIMTPNGNEGVLAYHRHADWIGSSRFASTPSETMYSDVAYAPFGEFYAQSGTTDLVFGGNAQDASVVEGATAGYAYDTLNRRYSAAQSRWVSPDPAGLGAVDFSNPQSWNRYAYVLNNPLAFTDMLGLQWWGQDCGLSGSNNCGNSRVILDGGEISGELGLLGNSDSTANCPQCLPGQGVGIDNKIYQYIPPSHGDCTAITDGAFCMSVTTGGLMVVGSLDSANNGLTISAAPPTPWYKNPCIQKALAKGALSAGIDAIGLIPGGGAVSEGLSLFHGAAAVSNGTAILGRVQLGAGIITTANGASNTSQLGFAQTALGVGGIVAGVAKAAPVVGQVLSGLSVVGDFVGTGMEIAECR
jgi:RHS repeat-associated protein